MIDIFGIKYDPFVLKGMAITFLKDREDDGEKSKQMIELLNRQYGITPEETMKNVIQLASVELR